jgi:hypothetical protein
MSTEELRTAWRKARNGPTTPTGVKAFKDATDKYIEHLEKGLDAYLAERKAHAEEEAIAARNRESLNADLKKRWADVE